MRCDRSGPTVEGKGQSGLFDKRPWQRVNVAPMPKYLVIVESPAKARTIGGFLGPDFIVDSSMGHIRDLPAKGLSVDIEHDFAVEYEVHASKKETISRLKKALKGADELLLATDEDREGEAISWHLLEVLKPTVPVKRMVFHEITQSAIEHAIEDSRDVDYGLVDAQESRRIVDRLYGYPVSEVVLAQDPHGPLGGPGPVAVACASSSSGSGSAWRSCPRATGTSAAAFPTEPAFTAALVSIDGSRVAGSRDFDSTGVTKRDDVAVLDEAAALGLKAGLDGQPFAVTSVETKPYTSRPKPPFITSTLQQVGGSRLRMSARQVMSIAQGLYEDGYITYMRTDSTTLSDHGDHRRPPGDRAPVRSRVPHRRAPDLRQEVEERPGGPRGHPARRRHLAQPGPAPRRAARRPAPPLRAHLAAHAGQPDARRPGQHGHRADRGHHH